MIRKLAFFFLAFLSFSISAASGEAIVGRVTDAATEQPLPGANVFIVDTFIGASTDAQGRFSIVGLQPGEYLLKAGYIGYKSVQKAVRIIIGDTLSV